MIIMLCLGYDFYSLDIFFLDFWGSLANTFRTTDLNESGIVQAGIFFSLPMTLFKSVESKIY